MRKACFYIDGYNLFYGLKSKKWKKYYWLDLQKLCQKIAQKHGLELSEIKYFTAKAKRDRETFVRQGLYLSAIQSLDRIKVVLGHYQKPRISICYKCKNSFKCSCNPPEEHFKHEEKLTDVNIAVNLLKDAYDDKYNTAFVISGDTDIIPAIEAVIERNLKIPEEKHIVAVFPPNRRSKKLRKICHDSFEISEGLIASCILPDPVITQSGFEIYCPDDWK